MEKMPAYAIIMIEMILAKTAMLTASFWFIRISY
jgi:hypothetical protein